MNNFEKRLFLDYLDKLLPETDVRSYNFDGIMEFFMEEFKVPRERIYSIFLKNMSKIIKKLSAKIKPRNTLLEHQLKLLKNIYKLNEDEYQVMIYATVKEVNNIFDSYFDCLNSNSFTTFAKKYLKLRIGKKERVMERLYLKNIVSSRHGSVDINDDLLKVFDNPNCNTSDKIMKAILGKTQKSKLCRKDYEHMEKETDMLINILSCAIEQKKSGMGMKDGISIRSGGRSRRRLFLFRGIWYDDQYQRMQLLRSLQAALRCIFRRITWLQPSQSDGKYISISRIALNEKPYQAGTGSAESEYSE